MKNLLFVLALIFFLPISHSLDMKIISEKHSIIDNEIVFEIENNQDIAEIKEYFPKLTDEKNNIRNIEYELYEEKVETRQKTIDYEETYFEKDGIEIPEKTITKEDLNAGLVVEKKRLKTKIIDENIPQKIVDKKIENAKKTENLIINVPAKSKKYLKVTWKNDISQFWGGAGSFEINPTSWWSGDWNARTLIRFDSNKASSGYNILVTFDGNYSLFNSNRKADGGDIRVVDYANSFEYPYYIFYSSANLLMLWFKADVNVGANYFYIYHGNSSATSTAGTVGNVFYLVDDFDDGDYTNNPPWFGGSGWTVSSGTYLRANATGSSALYTKLDRNFFAKNLFVSYYINRILQTQIEVSQTGVSPSPENGIQLNESQVLICRICNDANQVVNHFDPIVAFKQQDFLVDEKGFFSSFTSSPSSKYYLRIKKNVDKNALNYVLVQKNGYTGDFVDRIYISKADILDFNTFILGTELLSLDANIISIEDYNFSNDLPSFFNDYYYGDLTIKFTVKNQSPDMNIDLNISTSPTNGAGYNLANTQILNIPCDDYNFSDGSECQVSFNSKLYPDNNYFVFLKVSFDTKQIVKKTSKSFRIQNTPIFDLLDFKIKDYNSLDYNYTKALTIDVNYKCIDVNNSPSFAKHYINNNEKANNNLICNNSFQSFSNTLTDADGNKFVNAKFYINNSLIRTIDYNYFIFDNTPPTIILFDVNLASNSVFAQNPTLSFKLKCADASHKILYRVLANDTNIFASTDLNTNTQYFNYSNLPQSNTQFKAYCYDIAGNQNYTVLEKELKRKRFFFVWDVNGVALTGKPNYIYADINRVLVYSFDTNKFVDLFIDGNVSFYVNTFSTDTILITLQYQNVGFPLYVRNEFELDLLDDENISVCLSPLQNFNEQLLYSATTQKLKVVNASNGCYHLAGSTKYAFKDNLKISAYVIPLSYYLYYLDSKNNWVLLSLIEGSIANEHSIDLLKLKKQGTTQPLLDKEILTISKFCGTLPDCNTYFVRYYNPNKNNKNVTLKLLNGSNVLMIYTATAPNADDISYTFVSTNIPQDANTLTLKVEYERLTGETGTITEYVLPKTLTQPSLLHPTLAIIISIVIFLFGLTLIATKDVLTWFGFLLAIIGLTILSFSTQTWQVLFIEAIFIIIGAYTLFTFQENPRGVQ